MHSVSVNHLAASIVHLSSSVDSALMTPGHFALWAQLLHRYLLCEEGLRLTMIPPLNTMNTVEHHWTLWLLLPGSNYIESGRITKTIVLSELSTMFNILTIMVQQTMQLGKSMIPEHFANFANWYNNGELVTAEYGN